MSWTPLWGQNSRERETDQGMIETLTYGDGPCNMVGLALWFSGQRSSKLEVSWNSTFFKHGTKRTCYCQSIVWKWLQEMFKRLDKKGVFSLSNMTSWARCFFVVGVILCSIGCFKSIRGLYWLNASTEIPSTSWDNQKRLQTLPMPLERGQNHSLLRTIKLVASSSQILLPEYRQQKRTGCHQRGGCGIDVRTGRPEDTRHGGDQRQWPDQHNI